MKTSAVIAAATLATAMVSSAAPAAESYSKSVWGFTLPTHDSRHIEIRCKPGEYLAGEGSVYSDRMLSSWIRCTGKTLSGQWSGAVIYLNPVGQNRLGLPPRWHNCPDDHYVVGLAATIGTYSGGVGIQPTTPGLLADIQPLCLKPGVPPSFYQTTRAYFEHAEDNKLFDFAATGPGMRGSCPAGKAAVGLLYAVDFRRDIDPATQFQDVALICNTIPVDLMPLLTHVPHP